MISRNISFVKFKLALSLSFTLLFEVLLEDIGRIVVELMDMATWWIGGQFRVQVLIFNRVFRFFDCLTVDSLFL